MGKIKKVFFIAGLLVSLNLLHPWSGQADDFSTQIEAALQTDPLPADEVPPVGMFYLASDPTRPPLPCNLQQLSAWNLGNNNWLVDDLDEDTGFHSMMGRSMSMDVPSPGDGGDDGGGGDYTNYPSGGTPIDTNGLYLEITNVANGWSYLNLHNATNQVYSIWSTTNLATPFVDWNVEMELWPNGDQTNVMPFTVQNLERNPLFIHAEDWTGVTENGNTIPDWWLWMYFGTMALSDTNLDAAGNSLVSDYTNSTSPTVFTFTGLEVTNNYVSSSSASVQLDVAGSPYYAAVLVDDTNFNDAVWNTYSGSTATVNLGLTEGWHDVWIGLRGHADDASSAVWQWRRLKLDFTAPAIVITNPIAGTVDRPVIQLQGFCTEALSRISYDLTNALGLVTNQLVEVEGQAYSTNTWEFTTNYFQAFDVPLTNGLNTITLHATDLAGNITTLATNFTLDYSAKTNAPTVTLLWPLDGMEIVDSNIVCRGQVSDDTATVSVQLIDAAGNTNIVGSLVGRDGIFYAGNLTLADGTNYLTYTITDAVGNLTTTNITVSTSDLGLTLDPVVAGQTSVSGTIDDTNYVIYVNGVTATNNGDGTWSANTTPIGVGGGAVVVNAVNGGDPSLQQVIQSPQGVFVSSYNSFAKYTDNHPSYDPDSDHYQDFSYTKSLNWVDGAGGTGFLFNYDYGALLYPLFDNKTWLATRWPQSLPGGADSYYYGYLGGTILFFGTNFATAPTLIMEHSDATETSPNGTLQQVAGAQVKLATGGADGSRLMNLWCVSVSATAHTNSHDTSGTAVPPQNITVMGLTLDTNGCIYKVLADNSQSDVTPTVSGADNYTFNVSATKYHSYFDIYVEQANPGYSFLPYGPNYVGHASWSFSTEAPSDALQYISTNLTAYLNHSWGFFPGPSGSICSSNPGQLEGDGANSGANIHRKFYIGFRDLLSGLAVTRGMKIAPPAYCVTGFNCVSGARYAGFAADVFALPADQSPQNFGVTLMRMYPPILSGDLFDDETDIFYSSAPY